MLMRNWILYLLILNSALSKAQAYELGDLSMNFNYGAPQITPAVIKVGLNLYYKSKWADNSYQFSIKNTGVYNAKLEYGVHENLSLGFAASYWSMGIDLQHNYNDNHPVTNVKTDFLDSYHFDVSAMAVGLRGNYHFFGGEKRKVIDPYSGLTIGLTKYTYNVGFKSDYPDKKLPADTYHYKSGLSTYFSGTLGMRVYPVKYLGFNFEVGFDRGAFLFGGVVFKIHTNPPQFLKD